MKAIVYRKYGPPEVLKLEEVPKPTPKDNEVLVQIHVTTVTSGDYRIRNFVGISWLFKLFARLAFGLFRPRNKVLGMELAGIVEAVGKDVQSFQAGDEIFGFSGMDNGFGTYAEYICLPEDGVIAHKPKNMNFEQAASIYFGGHTAMSFLIDKANLTAGQSILINGASGGVGVIAVQLAKHLGATVTGICSTANVELVQSLGADHVIDYTKEDISQGDETYDIILDTVGKLPFNQCKNRLKENGKYLALCFELRELLQMLWTSKVGSKKVICAVANEKPEYLLYLKDLVEQGKLKAVIDRRYPFEQIPDAHAYVEQGHKKGSVVINVI